MNRIAIALCTALVVLAPAAAAQPVIDGDLSDGLYQTLATKLNANQGFGPDLDATEIVYYADLANETLYVGVVGRLNTFSSDGIGLWLGFSELNGAPAGAFIGGVPNAGHFMGASANPNYTADFEVDYAFAINPSGGATDVFFDAVKYTGGVQADYLGQANQSGTATLGPPDNLDNSGGPAFFQTVGFAFDNSAAGQTGLEFAIPFADLGIDAGAGATISASAFGVSTTAYFSDVTVPGNVTTFNPGFDANFNGNLTSTGCGCNNPGATIGTGPYNATGPLGSAPPENFDLEATNLTSLTVPAGGQVQFRYSISNNTNAPVSGDFFYVARRGASVVAQGVIQSGTVPANTTVGPLTYTQPIPSSAPAGTYSYTLSIGQFPALAVDSEAFTITVTSSERRGAPLASDWTVRDAAPWQGSVQSAMSALAVPATVGAAPNPFVGRTTLRYAVEAPSAVRLAVYDVLGREVALLVDGAVEAGQHEATFDARGLAPGVYVYRLAVGAAVQTGRLTLAR